MNMIICQGGNNPYLNNPRASLKAPQTQIMHEGKLYTKLSYELIINTATRLIKIIQALAITILSCFVALAFQSIRKLWQEGIKGTESVDVLMPQSFSQCTDIWMVIASSLSVKDLLAFGKTSVHNQSIAEKTLINRLNAGIITLGDIRITTLTSLIDFFGENCSQITKLNLEKFHQITDEDIEKISKHFSNLNHLLLKDSIITDTSAVHLAKMLLKSLSLSGCEQINDFSFLQHCKELTSLNLSGCNQINDISFLKHCKELTSLDLTRFGLIYDFSFLKHCKKLTSLNLTGQDQIKDVSFLQHCKFLTSLNLSWCYQIEDMSFLQDCKELTSLNLSGCNQINDFSFLKHCKKLTSLNISECKQINNISFLQHCKELTSLNLSFCREIDDLSFLQECKQLTSLDLSRCTQINDISFLQDYEELTSLNLSRCRQINDISFLQHCKKLTSLDLSWCEQINDISFLKHCKELTSLDVSFCDYINNNSVKFLRNRGVEIFGMINFQ